MTETSVLPKSVNVSFITPISGNMMFLKNRLSVLIVGTVNTVAIDRWISWQRKDHFGELKEMHLLIC
jgi:hypothetical protein